MYLGIIIQDLAHWNKVYEEKFGHIFIVCASGKSAEEMLHLIQARYDTGLGWFSKF